MQIIGFNLNKISAEKSKDFKIGLINTNVEFLNIEKEQVEMLKDKDVLKVDFKFTVNYKEEEKAKKNLAEVNIEGSILIAVESEESKETLKSWKNKETSTNLKTALFNVILKRCSIKALMLEDELGLPPHIPLPRVKNQ
jgi:hypothetical protein